MTTKQKIAFCNYAIKEYEKNPFMRVGICSQLCVFLGLKSFKAGLVSDEFPELLKYEPEVKIDKHWWFPRNEVGNHARKNLLISIKNQLLASPVH